MAGYTRQSSFADGDTITAALFNNEYNQLVNAFNNSTGHSHDGTAASGPVIGLIGDAGETSPNNKVLIDTTNNHIEFYVEVSSSSVQQLYIADGAIVPVTDNDIDLGTSSLEFKDAFFDGTVTTDALVADTADINGGTVDGATIGANSASTGAFTTVTTTGNVDVGGNLTVTGTTTFNGGTLTLGDADTDNIVFGGEVDSNIVPDDDNTYDLGSSSKEWKDLYIDGVAYLDAINFNGTAITSTAAELNILDGVTSTAAELNILDGVTATTAELNIMDGVTATTAELNIMDGVTATTAELNIMDGVTSTTAELNILDGVTSTASELNILDGVTSTATELNLLDGVTATTTELNYVDVSTVGTVEASKAIIVDGNKDFTGARNITITGELDAATLDVSGDVDIDGTLEADAITINGTTLAETISDTVGAMVTSNTETGVTVTYDDSDNTLDFVIGTLNQDTTGNAATATALETARTIGGTSFDGTANISVALADTATALATARTIHGVSFDGTANIDLSEVIQDTVGAMVSSNTESGITVTYEDSDGTLDFTVGTLNQSTTGNAATATALETARTIHGVSFDGTANIDLTEVVQDTVGAMFSSNTESGITVDYQDSDGTIDLTVGTLNQNTTGSAATLTTARTIGGVSFDGSANIVPTTFNAATFSGDVNVDSGVLFVDVSENKIGVNQTSPDVSLDLGSNTDSIHVPVGTTAQRPSSPAAGYFRYNSETGKFEGYTTEWGAIAGGGSGTNMDTNIFTGDGSDTTFTLSTAPDSENNLMVFVDGVFQAQNVYSVSGTTLTFATAPANGRVITVYHSTTTVGGSNNSIATMTGDGSDTTLTLSVAPVHENNVSVYFDGVYQNKDSFSVSGTTLTFGVAPPSGVAVEAITATNTSITTATQLSDADGDTMVQVEESSDEDKIRFDTGGTERVIIDSTGVGIGTSSPDSPLEIDGGSSANTVLHLTSTTANTFLKISDSNTNEGNFIGCTTDDLTFFTKNTERMRMTSKGSIGMGTTPPTDTHTGWTQLFIGQKGSVISENATGVHGLDGTFVTDNMYVDSDTGAFAYIEANESSAYRQEAGIHQFFTQASGSAGAAVTLSEKMRIDSTGNVSIGTTTTTAPLNVQCDGSARGIRIIGRDNGSSDEAAITFADNANTTTVDLITVGNALTIFQGGSETARLNAAGNLLIGTSTDVGVAGGGIRLTYPTSESDGDVYFSANGGGSNANPFVLKVVSQNLYDSGVAAMYVGRHSGNSRSINAGGTVNASGADYAEYMKKADSCGTIAKGDVCGVDSTGKLTDVFNNAISFVIKSTDPSYVGGDTWGSVDLNLTDEQYETERQKHDRIAFSGQVPVNITGSFNVGDYVYPQANGTAIQCVAKTNPTFEEYQLCVGKIWATQSDGKPLVAVKIG